MLKGFIEKHADAESSLQHWKRLTENAHWQNIIEVRRAFRHADAVTAGSGNTVTVFNIGGGKYRLISAIHYNTGRLFILRIYTHQEYDRIDWQGKL